MAVRSNDAVLTKKKGILPKGNIYFGCDGTCWLSGKGLQVRGRYFKIRKRRRRKRHKNTQNSSDGEQKY